MATFRVGIGSFIITEDKGVGFGTSPTDGLGNLRVKGVTKTTGSIVSGASTLTRYSGFAADNINQLENITLTSQVGTIGDIVVGVGTSVIISSGSTVTVGTVESVSIGTHFSPPTGGIEERGQDFVEGMMRFNTDLNTMEFYNGNEWKQFRYQADILNSPSTRGRALLMGGDPLDYGDQVPRIEFLQISTLGNTKSFGDLLAKNKRGAACSSSTRALHGGGQTPSITNQIQYVTIASEGDAIDFGDATHAAHMASGCASPTRGVWFVGDQSPATRIPELNFVTIASKGDGIRFGDLSKFGRDRGAASNSVRGIFGGGRMPALLDEIDYVTIASEGNATVFGDLTLPRWMAGQTASNNTRVVFMSGIAGDGPSYSDFTNIIDFITISTTGNAHDFGDVAFKTYSGGGCSDSHGGLGGY